MKTWIKPNKMMSLFHESRNLVKTLKMFPWDSSHPYKKIFFITVTWHGRYDVSNHGQLECLCNSFVRLTTEKYQSSAIFALYGFPSHRDNVRHSQRVSDARLFSMAWRHFVRNLSNVASRCIMMPIVIIAWYFFRDWSMILAKTKH